MCVKMTALIFNGTAGKGAISAYVLCRRLKGTELGESSPTASQLPVFMYLAADGKYSTVLAEGRFPVWRRKR